MSTTNSGTLEATGGGTLSIYASTVNNAGATISTDSSSTVYINDSTINGGNLTSAAGAVIHGINSATLNGVTITSGTTYSVDAGNSNYLTGDLVNKGTVNVGGGGGAASLYADTNNGTINLSGGGTINLNDPNSYLRGYFGNETLVNKDNTIQGQGYIYSLGSFQNQSTVNANVSGGTLSIYGVNTINSGTLEATGGGTLLIYGASVTNTGATISTDSSSNLVIEDSTITGGNLTAAPGAVIHGIDNTLNGVTLTSGTTYSVDPGYNTYLTADLVNKGTINVGSSSGGASLYAYANNGTINLSGGGTINLNNAGSYLRGNYGNETLVNVDNTIQGQGTIYNLGSFNNQAIVNANVAGGTLEINVNTTNTGTLEATGGGTLLIYGASVTNTGGTISTDSTSSVVIEDSTITGGNLTAAPGAVIHGIDNALNGVTLTSGTTYSVDPGYNTYLTADLVNKGTINVGSSSGGASLYAYANNGTINLSGGGTINLNNAGSYLRGNYGNETLVNVDNTIQGQGTIYNLGSFNNQAIVNANVAGGTLEINVNTTNTGTLEATGGGTLLIYGASVTNTGGTISTDSTSSVVIEDSTITGGNLTAAPGAVIHGIDNALNGVTLTSGTTYSVDPGYNTYLTADLVNKGTINVGSSSGGASLYADTNNGTINLSGGGTINLDNAGSSLRGNYGNETLVNHDNLIQGQGTIYNLGSFQNGGTVDANVSGGTLYIQNAPITNTGILRADAGATLNLNNTTLTNFSAGTLTGGTYQVYSGTLSFNNGGFTNDIVTNAANILLDGAKGAPQLLDQYGNNALANFATNATTGVFTIQNGVAVTSASTTDFTNAGTMTVGANSTFTVGGAHNFNNSGLLAGTGTVVAGLLSNSGTVHPGDGPGTLSITGNYMQTSAGILDIQLGGSTAGTGYSQLAVSGSATLDGMLDLSLINDFTPYNGELFVILTSGGLSGVFTDDTITIGNVTFNVEYSPQGYYNDVVLDAQVATSVTPEPSTFLIFGLGAIGMGALVVRRSRGKTHKV